MRKRCLSHGLVVGIVVGEIANFADSGRSAEGVIALGRLSRTDPMEGSFAGEDLNESEYLVMRRAREDEVENADWDEPVGQLSVAVGDGGVPPAVGGDASEEELAVLRGGVVGANPGH